MSSGPSAVISLSPEPGGEEGDKSLAVSNQAAMASYARVAQA